MGQVNLAVHRRILQHYGAKNSRYNYFPFLHFSCRYFLRITKGIKTYISECVKERARDLDEHFKSGKIYYMVCFPSV